MGVALAIVICVAIVSVVASITILGVAGMKYGDKYMCSKGHKDKKD